MNTKGRALRIGAAWLLTLVLLALGFGAYYNVYVRGRRQYFTEKRLRDLHFLADRLKIRIENLGSQVIPNAFTEQETIKPSTYDNCSQHASSIEGRLQRLTELVPGLTASAIKSTGPAGLTIEQKDNKAVLVLTLDVPWKGLRQRIRALTDADQLLEPYSEQEWFDQLMVADSNGRVLFHQGPSHLMVSNFKYLFGKATKPDQKSDESDSKSTTSDQQLAGNEWDAAGASSGVWQTTIAGEEQLVFMEPVQILVSESNRLEASWRIIGLVRNSRVSRESYAISYTIILLVVFLFLLAVAAWPFVKVLTLGPHDRLARYDVIILFVAAVLTAALGTFFATDLYSYNNLGQRLDLQLKCLADEIKRRFNDDLQALLLLSHELGELPPLKEGQRCNLAAGLATPGVADEVENGQPEGKLSAGNEIDVYGKALRKALLRGAFFQRVVWIDPDGMQRHKQTTGKINTSMIPVKKREYFRKLQGGDTWTTTLKEQGKQNEDGDTEVSFWLEPVVSRTTGELIATLSAPVPPRKKTAEKALNGDQRTWVVALDVELPSLRGAHVLLNDDSVRKVVLPPGYGFAVLDESDSVLFHSDEARHSNEDFFVESDRDPELRAIILGHASEPFSGRYLGVDHRFYVTRLRSEPGGPPWILVVFRDKTTARTANIETLSQGLILYGWLFASLLPVFLIFWMRHRETGWLWPDDTRLHLYRGLLPRLLVIAILFSIAIWLFSPPTLAYTSFVIPPAALLATRWKFHDGKVKGWWVVLAGALQAVIAAVWLWSPSPGNALWRGLLIIAAVVTVLCISTPAAVSRWASRRKFIRWLSGRKRWTPLTIHSAYLWTVAALLIVVGVLPAIAFFRIAWEKELNLYVKHGQREMALLMDARRQGLETKFRDIEGGKTLETSWKSSSNDVYNEFFFPCEQNSHVLQTCPARTRVSEQPSGDGQATRTNVLDEPESMLDSILELSRPLFNQAAIANHELAHNRTADQTYVWNRNALGCLQLTIGGDGRPSPARVPPAWHPVSFRVRVLAGLLAIGLALIIWRIATIIARQIFLLDLPLPRADAQVPANSDWQTIWKNCTDEERLALYDLASDNFVNRNNPALPSLAKRGLIVHPPLELCDREFENVVKREGAKKNAFRSLAADAPSTWQMLKWPLGIVMIAAATFLFFSQRHAFDTSLGFVGALVTGLTAVYKLLDVLRGSGRPS